MNVRFVEVTKTYRNGETRERCFINVDRIATIVPGFRNEGSIINFSEQDDDYINVAEDMDKIWRTLELLS